ncbi:MAG: hypothetical protein Ct9H300mP8_12600 [Gammaproteobacteria bacterium]|nr:MAG: hypothetical protein Ct9H300mP8_12600 [Gammaproteobacteria bacterium]
MSPPNAEPRWEAKRSRSIAFVIVGALEFYRSRFARPAPANGNPSTPLSVGDNNFVGLWSRPSRWELLNQFQPTTGKRYGSEDLLASSKMPHLHESQRMTPIAHPWSEYSL